MKFEPQEMLYRKLANITAGVRSALMKDDIEALNRLAEKHKVVMNELENAGFSRDPQLRGLVHAIKHQVQEVVIEMERRRDKTRRELKAHANRRKLARAYGL